MRPGILGVGQATIVDRTGGKTAAMAEMVLAEVRAGRAVTVCTSNRPRWRLELHHAGATFAEVAKVSFEDLAGDAP